MSQGSQQGKSLSATEKFSAEECSIFLTPFKADIPVTADLCYSKLCLQEGKVLLQRMHQQLKSAPLRLQVVIHGFLSSFEFPVV